MITTQFRVLGLLGLLVAAGLYLAEIDAFARAGGGMSSGSRGSRSFSSPSRPYTSPSSPQPSQQPLTQPRPVAPTPAPQPAPAGSFWRSMAGGLAGGFLGAMLFRGLAGAGGFGGMGGAGIGLMDLLLLAAIGYGIYWWVKKRRQEEAVPAEGYYERQAGVGYYGPELKEGATPAQEPLFQDGDRQAGLSHIRQMDARFDEAAFRELCTDNFFKIQAGWMNREVDPIANLLTVEMQNEFRKQLDGLKQQGRINRLENIAVRTVEITEAWQETGQDYITVRFLANLLDSTVDERTGQVVEGSKTEPVKFEEYWTWTRPVGPNPWRLSAINQPD
jgi:predicted lipid-binding transport protein (Tim44 family)